MDIFSVFFSMKVCCVFSLELPHRGDSNEFTQYTIFNVTKKITLNFPKSAALGFCAKGLKNEFELATANEPSVFEPLKFYCILINLRIYNACLNETQKYMLSVCPLINGSRQCIKKRKQLRVTYVQSDQSHPFFQTLLSLPRALCFYNIGLVLHHFRGVLCVLFHICFYRH